MYATRLGVSTMIAGKLPTLGVMASVVMRDMSATLKKRAPVEPKRAPKKPFAHIAREVVSTPVSYKSHEKRIPWVVLLATKTKGRKLYRTATPLYEPHTAYCASDEVVQKEDPSTPEFVLIGDSIGDSGFRTG